MGLLVDAGGLLVLALWVFCVIEVIMTDGSRCRSLPKPLWLLIVLILPDVGSVAWLVAGRPRAAWRPAAPAYDAGAGRPLPPSPDDDEDFLRGLRERVEEQRRKAREQRDSKDE